MDWRSYDTTDLPGVAALFATALEFDRPSPEYVRYLLHDDPGFDPELIWIAADGGRIEIKKKKKKRKKKENKIFFCFFVWYVFLVQRK